MKTGTSSLMDGKNYKQNKVMRIDDINAIADADVRENEQLEKLSEEVYGKGVKEDYEEGFIDGYNKAKETLYTKQDMIDLVESLKDYTKESHTILGHDSRESSEFVDIFLDYTNYQDNE